MELGIDKCSFLETRGTEKEFHVTRKFLKTEGEVKEFGITDSKNLSWKPHINGRLKKVNLVSNSIRRNKAFKVKNSVKFGIDNSLVLLILIYGLDCLALAKSFLQN